jgi:acyl carrier protein
LNSNGKVDRQALPVPEADSYQFKAPVGNIETTLAAIWADLLKVERVGRNDNFFDLGGRSLLTVLVANRLRQAFGVELTMRDLFAYPVLVDLARAVEGAGRKALPPITRRQARATY